MEDCLIWFSERYGEENYNKTKKTMSYYNLDLDFILKETNNKFKLEYPTISTIIYDLFNKNENANEFNRYDGAIVIINDDNIQLIKDILNDYNILYKMTNMNLTGEYEGKELIFECLYVDKFMYRIEKIKKIKQRTI